MLPTPLAISTAHRRDSTPSLAVVTVSNATTGGDMSEVINCPFCGEEVYNIRLPTHIGQCDQTDQTDDIAVCNS
jgi:hypothetical protein